MTGSVCLAIDLGTGGPKVGLVTTDGTVLDHQVHSVTTTFGPDGSATQDAAAWWAIIRRAARELLARHPDAAARTTAVAITGQWASTVPVDANGTPTGPCWTWQDTRGGALVRDRVGGPIAGYRPRAVLSFIRRSGGAPSLVGADPIGHLLGIPHLSPEVDAATRWYMEPVDYLTMAFTGIASATHASRQGSWLTDTRHLDRFTYDATLLARIGVSDEKLPPLVPIGAVIGTVLPSIASELGLPATCVVITGVPDLHAAALGAATTAPGIGHLALSTTSWISGVTGKKKTDIAHSIATVPGLTNTDYLVVNNQDTGAKALEWLRSVLHPGGGASFDDLTALAATAPAGSGGVRFTPWLAGERSPLEDHQLRGTFSGLSLQTDAAAMIRAVLEGVAANSAWLLGHVESFVGAPFSELRMVGGGAISPLWCQIMADTCNRTVEQVPDPMVAQLRGMAHLAGIALREFTLDDLNQLRHRGTLFTPRPEGVAALEPVVGALPKRARADRRLR